MNRRLFLSSVGLGGLAVAVPTSQEGLREVKLQLLRCRVFVETDDAESVAFINKVFGDPELRCTWHEAYLRYCRRNHIEKEQILMLRERNT